MLLWFLWIVRFASSRLEVTSPFSFMVEWRRFRKLKRLGNWNASEIETLWKLKRFGNWNALEIETLWKLKRVSVQGECQTISQSLWCFSYTSDLKWQKFVTLFLYPTRIRGILEDLCSKEVLAKFRYSCTIQLCLWGIAFTMSHSVLWIYHILLHGCNPFCCLAGRLQHFIKIAN